MSTDTTDARRVQEPVYRVQNGKRLGNATAAGLQCDPPIGPASLRWYSNNGKPDAAPCPKPVGRDRETGQWLFDLDAIKTWDQARPGRGNWDGEGAKARRANIDRRECPSCHQQINIDDHAEWRRHFVVVGGRRRRCPTGETRCADVEPTVTDEPELAQV